MATEHHPQHHTDLQRESPMDYAQHEATYGAFTSGVKWTVISAAILLIILYFIINP